jgi:ankyrin repeat protein
LEYLLDENTIKYTDVNGNSLLMLAAKKSLTCVKMLLGKGADPNQKNRRQSMPLFFACTSNNSEIIDEVTLILCFH